MSDIIAGDFINFTADHSELGPFSYEQKSGGENKVTPGGLVANSDDQGITNAGNVIWVYNRQRGKYSLEVAATSGSQKYTLDTSRNQLPTTYTGTRADGTTVTIVGKPTGAMQFDNQTGTYTLNIEGKEIDFK